MAKIKIINDKGEEEEIETFTKEEVDKTLQEKEEEFNKKISEHTQEVEKLALEKAELEKKISDAQLSGIKDDHPNFKILKEALTKKDAEISEIKITLEKDKQERQVSSLVNKYSKGNEELEKKIRFHLENSVAGMKGDTSENLQKKIEAAVKLSFDGNEQGMFDSGISGGGSGNYNYNNNNSVEFSAREKALGQKLGITEEDYKKYGPRLNK